MEEINRDKPRHLNDTICSIDNDVSHEVTVESQTTSERRISQDNSIQNLTNTQENEGGNNDKNTGEGDHIVAGANVDTATVSNIQEINKEMDNVDDPKLSEKSFQHDSPTKNSEEWLKDVNKGNEEQNIVTAEAGTAILTINQEDDKMVNIERPSEWRIRSVSPNDLVISENDQSTENVLENTKTENLDEINNKNNTDSKTPNISGEVSNVPPVLLRSVQKLFPTAQENNQDRDLQAMNNNTSIIIPAKNDNVAISLSQISLGNTATAVTTAQNATSAGSAGKLAESEQKKDTSDRVGNIVNKIDYKYFFPSSQFSRISNYNRRIGLCNIGSTCYVNSVMQALLATNRFSTFAVMRMYNYPYWSLLAELFGNMMYNIFPVVNPLSFYSKLNSPYFNIYKEHDASEFLMFLLELLKSYEPEWERDTASSNVRPSRTDSWNDATAGCSYQAAEATPRKRPKIVGFNSARKYYIDNLFGGIIATIVQCQTCRTISNKYEMVHILHLSFPDVMVDEVLTVQSLLNYYFTTEALIGDNRYMCDTCQCHQDALKTSFYAHTPKYLILTLKNFRYDSERKILLKKIRRVHCDDTILLHSTTNKKEIKNYNLYAVIVHCGNLLNTGHYTAFTKCNGQWYMISDKKVEIKNQDDINRLNADETPYMLFYRRTDIKEGEFPEFDRIPWLSQYVEKQLDAPQENISN